MKKLLLFLTVICLLFAFENIQAQTAAGDAITNITFPATATQGDAITVSVDYTAPNGDRDLNIAIQDVNNVTVQGTFKKVTVTQGTNTANITINIPMSTPVANDYQINCYMTEVGGNWNIDFPGMRVSPLSIEALVIYDIPVYNGDVENTTAMFQDADNENKWTIEGMWFAENGGSFFDATNSGLAAGEGRNSSQALKSTVFNASGVSAGVVLLVGDVDISANGPGSYTFTFFAKSLSAPTARPFWIVCNAFDQDHADVTGATLTKVDNGGTVTFNGLEGGYLQQSVTVNIAENTSGNNAQYLRMQIQHGKFNNSYWFDDFTLSGPEGTSTSISNRHAELGINVFPNPASTATTITSETTIKRVSLYALSGKLMTDVKVNEPEFQLDLTPFSKGLYLLSVTSENGTSSSKLIIQ